MRLYIYIFIAILIALPINSFGQPLVQSFITQTSTDAGDEEVLTYYDLRDRKTYIQVTNNGEQGESTENPICIHVQIFQQDRGCSELNFEDSLTINDTIIYDLDNLVRNDGSEVAITLDDDSYGIVTISSFTCGDRGSESFSNIGPLIGNVRIIDDAGYEYRMNLFADVTGPTILPPSTENIEASGKIIVPFNTVDGAQYSDVIVFITEQNRFSNGQDGPGAAYNMYNEEVGVTFDVFQFDENEEPLSCDQKTIGCGPNVVLNYGINEDYPNSRGGPLLCEGAGLLPGQQHGYISLENPSFLSPISNVPDPSSDDFEFVCIVGINNGDNTGSMDECRFACTSESDPECDDE